MGNAVTSETK
jgi:hypothetical protein